MMFSHLCTATPSVLWEKFKERYQTPEIRESTTGRQVEEEDHCELEKCTFCDYRVCCQVTSSSLSDWETKCLEISDLKPQVTDNPAYGLFSQNWSEVKRGNDDDRVLDTDSNYDLNEDAKRENLNENPTILTLREQSITQRGQDCDSKTVCNMNKKNIQSIFQQTKDESRLQHIDNTKETPKNVQCNNDQVNGRLLWSVLRQRQFGGDILKNCDKSNNVIEKSKANENGPKNACHNKNADSENISKGKRNIKDRSFPLSLMKPIVKIGEKKSEHLQQKQTSQTPKKDISRQCTAQKCIEEKNQKSVKREANCTRRLSNDILGLNNPLSEIEQVKTEESIQEWLARISESSNGSWTEESEDKKQKEATQNSAWDLTNNTDEETNLASDRHKLHLKQSNMNRNFLKKPELTRSREKLFYNFTPNREESDTADMLSSASKGSPVQVPMVIMQCSRLHLQIGGKTPLQQNSLPMGTLVTALYQESDWLYIQTPHGIEGFVSSSNCAPIGTISEPMQTLRKPWEPCDFPIHVNAPKMREFSVQGSYISEMLPDSSSFKEASPLVNTIKLKANFYNDRYLPNQTFKTKDSIKIAKTVTDILRNSPDTSISNL